MLVINCVCRKWLGTWSLLRVPQWMPRTMLAGHLCMKLAAAATVKWQNCCYTMEQMPTLAPEMGQGMHVQSPSPVHPSIADEACYWPVCLLHDATQHLGLPLSHSLLMAIAAHIGEWVQKIYNLYRSWSICKVEKHCFSRWNIFPWSGTPHCLSDYERKSPLFF